MRYWIRGTIYSKNKGTAPIENWEISLDFQHEISKIWDGKISKHSGNNYIITGPQWNPSIAVGGQTIVGFIAKCEKNINSPTNCTLNGNEAEEQDENCSIEYETTVGWEDGFNGKIKITNNSDVELKNWELEFDFDRKIEQFWTAKIKKHSGNHGILSLNPIKSLYLDLMLLQVVY